MSAGAAIGRPEAAEFGAFYAGYVARVTESDVLEALRGQAERLRRAAAAVPREREGFRYAPGKWSIRQVFGHVTDAERVFGYRALCVGRGDATPLPGFEENAWAERAPWADAPLAGIAAEFAQVREGHLAMLSRLSPDDWRRAGTASGSPVSVRALAFIMAGHVRHHLHVLEERYGVAPT